MPDVTHAPYRREPYVRVRFPDGTTQDAKAVAWTRTQVLVHWDDGRRHHERWAPAAAVTRICREDSTWQDPYDLHDVKPSTT